MAGTLSCPPHFYIMERVITLFNGLRLYVDSREQPSFVPWLLADFAMLKGNKSVIEFCSGNGAASFWAINHGLQGEVTLLDNRESVLKLSEKTVSENRLTGVSFVCEDLERFSTSKKYDAVMCNPPFFAESIQSLDLDQRAIRHESGTMMDLVCEKASKALKQKGHFYVCHIPTRTIELLLTLEKYHLKAKKMRLCRNTKDSTPFLILLDAMYMGGEGLQILPDLIVKDQNGEDTEEIRRIMKGKPYG